MLSNLILITLRAFSIIQSYFPFPATQISVKSQQNTFSLPNPLGSYPIGCQIHDFHDLARPDPLAPHHHPHHRIVPISLFYPAAPHALSPLPHEEVGWTPYMPPQTASFYDQAFAPVFHLNKTFSRITSPCYPNAPFLAPSANETFPLLLFSPGAGASRFFYTILAEDLASKGYVLALLDHPYDAEIVELANGTIIRGGNISTHAEAERIAQTSADDLLFILERLLAHKGSSDSPFRQAEFDEKSKIGVVGHSLGGAAALSAIHGDRKNRIAAAINIDGPVHGPVTHTGIQSPILFLQSDWRHWHRPTAPLHPRFSKAWKKVWRRSWGWKREVMVKGARHETFSDLPTVIEGVLGIERGDLPDNLGREFGTIGWERGREVLAGVVGSFFDWALKGMGVPFEGNGTHWEEVVVER